MSNVYVIGHKNPDTDSVCSAYAYAKLKNEIDKENKYIPARCGHLNPQTKFVFEYMKEQSPIFLKDVYPKVADVMTKNVIFSKPDDPIYHVVKNIESMSIRLTPIKDAQGNYKGVASILEISKFFLPVDLETKPLYLVNTHNLKIMLDGEHVALGKSFEFRASILVGAMPYETFIDKFRDLKFSETILVVGKRRDFINYAIKNNFACIIVTGISSRNEFDFDLTDYKGTVFISRHDTAETVRRVVLSVPAKSIMVDNVPTVDPDTLLEEAKELMVNENHRGLPVVNGGKLEGIITRSDILKIKPTKLILMDHNEITQSVDGAEFSEIIEVIDHHRLGTIKTKKPVFFYAKPVGSTCTLVYQQYRLNGIIPDEKCAIAMLSGIISDTVVLKSPTTTSEDETAAKELSALLNLSFESYGKKIFESSSFLKGRKVEDIVNSDFKIYEEHGIRFGAGQIETVNLQELSSIKYDLIEELKKNISEKKLNFCLLLVTDIIEGDSIMLTSGYPPIEKNISYKRLEDNVYDLPGVLSRKKQLLPEILRVIEMLKS